VFETEGDGLLAVGELVADGVRDRWSRWILMTSLGWNGSRHIGQTRLVKDLRHLRLDQSQYENGRRGGLVHRAVRVGRNQLASDKTRVHIGGHGELCSDRLR